MATPSEFDGAYFTMFNITIDHKPQCGTSRNTLALIRESGAELAVFEYFKTPPNSRAL